VTRVITILAFFFSFTAMVATGESREEKPNAEADSVVNQSRPYEDAPPLIPHDIDDYRITRSENACLGCHLDFYEVPFSHYLNEHTNEQKFGEVAGIRYNCVQCHLPKTSLGIKKKIDIRNPRPYEDAPPTVPHLLVDIEISKTANTCLECHLDDESIKPSPSHFINGHTGEQKQDQVTGTRYNCLQCHLPSASIKASLESKGGSKNTCIKCHSVLLDDRLSKPVKLWAGSVHAEVGNTCDGCHGGDPRDPTGRAMSLERDFQAAPNKKEVATFCGKCHQGLSAKYMTSTHWKKRAQSCVDCHGSHTIQRASSEIVSEEKCGKCHDYDVADKFNNILQSLQSRIETSEEQTKLIFGFPIEPIEEDLNRVWKKFRQVRMVSHTTDFKLIKIETEKVDALLESTNSEISRLLDLGEERRLIGYSLIVTFLLLALVTYFYNKRHE
jgi:nitrate reductase cytochrome c-type subunit